VVNALDSCYKISWSKNAEVLARWNKILVMSRDKNQLPKVREFVMGTGRQTHITEVYRMLANYGDSALTSFAESLFEEKKSSFHAVTEEAVRTILTPNLMKKSSDGTTQNAPVIYAALEKTPQDRVDSKSRRNDGGEEGSISISVQIPRVEIEESSS